MAEEVEFILRAVDLEELGIKLTFINTDSVRRREQARCNALLLAAAPELLEAAEEFAAYEKAMDEEDDLTAVDLYESFSKKMHAAIAKARGEQQ